MSDAAVDEVVRRASAGEDAPSLDPRAVRTRRRIVDAVTELSDAGCDISVASLCRAAEVSRASFYAHYADLDALASSLLRGVFVGVVQEFRANSRPQRIRVPASHRRFVDELVAHRALYRAAALLPVSKEGYLANVRFLASLLEPIIAEHAEGRPVPATARYVASAVCGLVDAWLTGEVELSDDDLVERLTALVPAWYID